MTLRSPKKKELPESKFCMKRKISGFHGGDYEE
jgi:hypothetical protein